MQRNATVAPRAFNRQQVQRIPEASVQFPDNDMVPSVHAEVNLAASRAIAERLAAGLGLVLVDAGPSKLGEFGQQLLPVILFTALPLDLEAVYLVSGTLTDVDVAKGHH